MKWVLCFLPLLVFGKDFGRMGQVFPIEEESFLEFIQRSFLPGALDQKMVQAKQKLFEQAKSPLPVKGIKVAETSRSFLLDISFTVKKDVKDLKGRVIVQAGTKINPLEKLHLSSGLLFLDGDEEKQLCWARQQKGEFKWLLVKGKPAELEISEKRPIYFDQEGLYSSRFLIENIPARIVQKGKYLLVEEVGLEGL